MSRSSGTPEGKRKSARKKAASDPIGADFGPGPEPTPPESAFPPGPIPGMPCGGQACFLHPVANLASRFALRMARGHGGSLGRAAFSGIELMKALRDFLDEEIAFAERAAGRAGPAKPGYERIKVD
jgi:hypothetical protein